MGIISRLPEWSLNYQVAAFGAYATILVELIYLILIGFNHSSLLSISILTNGSAVLVAGFGGASSTPLAALQICLTSLFLLWAILFQGNDHFNGTYAILCSVAQFTYQLLLRHYGNHSEVLPQHEKCTKAEEVPSESCLHSPPTDYNDAATFSGSLRIFFGDAFCLEGAIVPVIILGTVMTYRVLDFDLGFGLVFAFMSAFLSSIVLLFINSARLRGRQVDTQKSIRVLIGLLLVIGMFCFVLSTTMEVQDPELSWWRIAFGVAWFVFLFRTTYIACRFLTHAILFPCTACSQREEGIIGPLTLDASAACIWDSYVTLPALNQNQDPTSEMSATFRVKRQKGPDLVDWFWLNDQEWFQISPRSFVIFFVSCIALASFSSGALNPEGSFANIGSHISKATIFYVTMAFTFVFTGHTAAEDSPELMFVPLRHGFPEWKTIAKAIITTMLVHVYIVVFVAPADPVITVVTPLACITMAPLLVAGISKPLDPRRQQGSTETGIEAESVSVTTDELVSSTAKTWTVDSTLVYSSSRIRRFDIRVLLLGLSIALFDVLCNHYQGGVFSTGWPTSAVIAMSVTAVWLYIENMLSRSQDLEPGLLSLAVAALVGNNIPVYFPSTSGLYDNAWGNKNSTDAELIPDIAGRSDPILIALWYSTLVSMIVVNHRLNNQKVDGALPLTDGRPHMKDHLLFGFCVEKFKISFAWKLRNSRVAISLTLAWLASFLGENWPLEGNTTAASLLLFTLIVGFQGKDPSDDKRSLPHIAALGFSTLMTVLAVGLNRKGVFRDFVTDPNSDWKTGTWSALVFYQLFLAVSLRLDGNGSLTRPCHVKVPLTEDLQNEEKATAPERREAEICDYS